MYEDWIGNLGDGFDCAFFGRLEKQKPLKY